MCAKQTSDAQEVAAVPEAFSAPEQSPSDPFEVWLCKFSRQDARDIRDLAVLHCKGCTDTQIAFALEVSEDQCRAWKVSLSDAGFLPKAEVLVSSKGKRRAEQRLNSIRVRRARDTRMRDVLRLSKQGKTAFEIANSLNIAPSTVNADRRSLLEKGHCWETKSNASNFWTGKSQGSAADNISTDTRIMNTLRRWGYIPVAPLTSCDWMSAKQIQSNRQRHNRMALKTISRSALYRCGNQVLTYSELVAEAERITKEKNDGEKGP